jgi:hypothetical protein
MLKRLLATGAALLLIIASASARITGVTFSTPFQYSSMGDSYTATMTNGSASFTITAAPSPPAMGAPTSGTPIFQFSTPFTGFATGTTISGACTGTFPSAYVCTASNTWAGSSGTTSLDAYTVIVDSLFNTQCNNSTIFSTAGDQILYNYGVSSTGSSNAYHTNNLGLFTLSKATVGAVINGGMAFTKVNAGGHDSTLQQIGLETNSRQAQTALHQNRMGFFAFIPAALTICLC